MPASKTARTQIKPGLVALCVEEGIPHTLTISAGHELMINALHFSNLKGELQIRAGSGPYVTLFSTSILGVFAGPLLLQGPASVTFQATRNCDIVGSCVDVNVVEDGEWVQDFREIGGADETVVDDGALKQQGGGDTEVGDGGGDDDNDDDDDDKESAEPSAPPPPSPPPAEKLTSQEKKKMRKRRREEAKKKEKELREALKRQRPDDDRDEEEDSLDEPKQRKKVLSVLRTRTLKGKVKVSDTIIGSGSTPRPGSLISLLYEGTLTDGTVFDKNMNRRAPLKFRMGLNEVIKGLEIGLADMRAGGERTIVVPPEMGYGKKKKGGIPPNSTLTFRVQLL